MIESKKQIEARIIALVKKNSFFLRMNPDLKCVLREWATHSNFNEVLKELK